MSVIHRYITASFLKYFCFVLILVVGIYLSVDFIDRIEDFIESGRPAGSVVLYFLLKIPLILSQITPLAVLLAALIIFGLMNKNNEIIALKSGGISVFYLLAPVAVLGVIFSVALFVFSEVVVPISAAKALHIEENKTGDALAVSSREKNIWIRQKGNIVNVKYYHPSEAVLQGVSFYFFDSDFNLVRRLDAESAGYREGRWVLSDCMEQRFGRDATAGQDRAAQTRYYDNKEVSIDLKPSDFKQVARQSVEMSFTALWEYIKEIEAEGYDATKYRVDLYAKTAFPAVCLIMSLMGAGLALRGSAGEGMAASFAYAIVTAFVYWTVYSFCLSLGYGDVLPAWLAAWIANILFGFGVALLLLNLE